MTTRVIIQSDHTNKQDVVVQSIATHLTIAPGERMEFYVYPGRTLTVSEGPESGREHTA